MKALIVGCGVMGSWMARFWKENLGDVTVTDIDRHRASRVGLKLGVKWVSAKKLEPDADVVVVAVPIKETPGVVEELAPKLAKSSLLFDLSSVKERVVKTLKELEASCELASLHPLFGPGATTIQGKDVLSVPVRVGPVYRRFTRAMESLGAKITELSAEEHDKLMAVIQCMTHFVLLAYLSAYDTLRDFDKRPVRTPLFDSLFGTAEAMLAASPELYGEIQVYNAYSRIVRARLIEECKRLDTVFSAGNIKSVQELFDRLRKVFSERHIQEMYRRLYSRFEVAK
jgi:prephenate dehydrogenase